MQRLQNQLTLLNQSDAYSGQDDPEHWILHGEWSRSGPLENYVIVLFLCQQLFENPEE